MSPSDFCMWLAGCLDIMETKTLSTKQVEMIKEKLATVEHSIKKVPVNTKSPEIYIPLPNPIIPTPSHPDLGPDIQWSDKNSR